jgi:phage N-6-adenine-methyltransferase
MTDREMSTERKSSHLQLYDPEKGLKGIAVAEAAEKHWARAKDAAKLCEAIEQKINAQADYVVWRDGVVEPSQKTGGPGRGKRVSELRPHNLPDADPGKRVIHRWRKKLCLKNEDGRTVKDAAKVARTVKDVVKITEALIDAQHRCVRICEQENANTIRGTEGTGEFERYTPAKYIEAARMVLGTIDLDPATSELAQETVKAEDFYVEEEDGLDKEWIGRVWLNPPYHRELAPKFIKKLVQEYTAGRTTTAILLTNNCTDTEWFDVAIRAAASACFTNGRIKFTTPKGKEVLPTQGQAFLYFGDNAQRFEDVFCVIGFCVRPSRQYEKITTIEAAAQ